MFKFLCFFLFLGQFAAAKTLVRFLPDVSLSPFQSFTMADIVEVENGSLEDLQLLESIVLPRHQVWSAQGLTQILKENIPSHNFQILLPQKVSLQFESQLSKSHLERRMMNVLSAKEGQAKVEVRIHALPKVSDEIAFVDWSYVKRGSFLLPLSLKNDPNPLLISAQTKVSKLLPVAQKNISTQFRVQQEDLKLDWVDVTFAKEGELSQAQIIGHSLNRSLMFGQAVWPSFIKREPTIKKGQLIRAKVGGADYEIYVSVVAEEAGFIGDTIVVKPTETQKKLSALIESKESIRIQ